jgi:hypothetical protein
VTDVAIGAGCLAGLAVLLLASRGRLGLPPGRTAPLDGPQQERDVTDLQPRPAP